MKDLKFEVIPMKDVPDPPVGSYRGGRYLPLFEAIKKLGYAQKDALRVGSLEKKELAYIKTQLATMAKREGLRILSSRNQASTVAFFWAIKLDKSV